MRAVLYTRGRAAEALAARIAKLAGVELDFCRTPEQAASALADAELLLLQQSLYCGVVEEAACSSPKLSWIQLLSAGYEKLLERRLSPRLVVTSAGPSFAGAVADHALALMLSLTRRIPQAVENHRNGVWDESALAGAVSLEGRNGLIVGFGSIGQRVAARLRGFGMRVSGLNRSGRPHPAANRMYSTAELDQALAEAHVVIIAVPQTPETEKLFDAGRLARCRKGAYLINVARGQVVDLDALCESLVSGHLSGAALDVTDPEPLPAHHPSWTTPNLLITPHVGGAGAEAELVKFVAANIEAFAAGRPLASRVYPGWP